MQNFDGLVLWYASCEIVRLTMDFCDLVILIVGSYI